MTIVTRATCSSCGGPADRPGQSWCRACHSAYMRQWRKTHPLSEGERRKDNARSTATVYLRRGKLTRESCSRCGETSAQMHHPDYAQPLAVVWLCAPCHRAEHKRLRSTPQRRLEKLLAGLDRNDDLSRRLRTRIEAVVAERTGAHS